MGGLRMKHNLSTLASLTCAAYLALQPIALGAQETESTAPAIEQEEAVSYSATEYDNYQAWDTALILKDAPVQYVNANADIESIIQENGVPGVYLMLHKDTVESKNVAKIFADLYTAHDISDDEFRLYVVQFDSPLMNTDYMVISDAQREILQDKGLFSATFPIWELYDIEDGQVRREWSHTYGGPDSRDETNEYATLVRTITESRLFD